MLKHFTNGFQSDRRLFAIIKTLILITATFIAYMPAINGKFIWDDDSYITNNSLLASASGLWKIWFSMETPQYYPLVFTSFWIENHLWGLNPAGYHIINIMLHSANAVFVWVICRRIGAAGGFLAGLIFALHPVNVESVAWITERKNVLSGLFYLSAIFCFIRYEDRKTLRMYLMALVFFVGALLSKTVTSTLPAALLIIHWFRGGEINRRYLVRLTPFLAAGVAAGLVTVWWEANIVGASGKEWALSPVHRMLLPGRVALFYIYKLLIPVNLTFIYPRWTLDPADATQWLYPISLLAVLAAAWYLRKFLGKGVFAGISFFIVALLPALGFFNVYPFQYSFVADHFQYLASIGVIAAFSGFLAYAIGKTGVSLKNGFYSAAIIAFALGLGTLTWKQCLVYNNLETLWRDTLRKNPGAFIAHNNLGKILYNSGKFEEAMEHYNRAVELKPASTQPRFNLGLIYLKLGRVEEAAGQFRLALEADPDNAIAHVNLGSLLADQGDYDLAMEHYLKALKIVPNQIMAHNNLAAVLAKTGRFEEAVEHLQFVVKVAPDYIAARQNLGKLLMSLGRKAEAEEHFQYIMRAKAAHAEADDGTGEPLAAEGK